MFFPFLLCRCVLINADTFSCKVQWFLLFFFWLFVSFFFFFTKNQCDSITERRTENPNVNTFLCASQKLIFIANNDIKWWIRIGRVCMIPSERIVAEICWILPDNFLIIDIYLSLFRVFHSNIPVILYFHQKKKKNIFQRHFLLLHFHHTIAGIFLY